MNLTLKLTAGALAAAALFGAGMFTARHWPNDTQEADAGLHRNAVKSDARKIREEPTQRPRYRATSVFRINRTAGPETDAGNAQGEDPHWFDAQCKALSSRSTLILAAKNLELDIAWKKPPAEAAGRLAELIDVEPEAATETVSLSARSARAGEAVAIANGVRDAYAQKRLETEAARGLTVRENISARIEQQQSRVEKARLEMLDLMKRHQIVDLTVFNVPKDQEEALRARLNDDSEIAATPEAQGATEAVDAVAEVQIQSEYRAAKHKYETRLQLLNHIREHEVKFDVSTPSKKPVEILEPAVAVEDR